MWINVDKPCRVVVRRKRQNLCESPTDPGLSSSYNPSLGERWVNIRGETRGVRAEGQPGPRVGAGLALLNSRGVRLF